MAKVLKFGGSSVATSESITKVKAIVEQSADNKFVVVSALGGVTDQLVKASAMAALGDENFKKELNEVEQRHLNVAKSLIKPQQQGHVLSELKVMLNELEDYLQSIARLRELTPKLQDYALSFGERMSAFLLSETIADAVLVDSRSIIKTDSTFGKANVNFEKTNALSSATLREVKGRAVLPGFIASDENGNTTTLGRGGSDYTAAILAAAIGASSVEIWTDVSGFMTADPRKVEKAYPIKHLSYSEVFELSNFGAKVIYPPTVHPLLADNIAMLIKNTFNPTADGTLVNANADDTPGSQAIKGISSIDEIALLTLHGVGMTGISGISQRLFGALAEAKVNVILISQASSEQSITFAIVPEHVEQAKQAIEHEFEVEIHHQTIGLKIETEMSIIAIVGENMKRMPGISGKLFNALGKNGVNVVAIAQGSSELNISTVVHRLNLRKALNVIHEAFFLSGYREVHLYIAGIGTVGGNLVQQIRQQRKNLMKNHHLKINVVGVMNSKKMLFDVQGINLDEVRDELERKGAPLNLSSFVQRIASVNLRNSIFVDCTASAEVADIYEKALQSFVSVVTANKIACSSSYERYQTLQSASRTRGVKFLYETNVGAGLPVIKTINELVLSGDKVTKLEAVLSGTLNFIFNTISEEISMSQAIRMAKEKGYSEPDPRVDLSGADVLRKILILSRECGYPLEKSDVEVSTFLPARCFDTPTVEMFFDEVQQLDADFEARRRALYAAGRRWRFVASLSEGKAKIGLQEVDAMHPFFNLQGSDNIITLHTERYSALPMVIKGAGAGAAVTAAGVFGDIIRVANI
ncbi:MAG: bifunctional aspartate kinase/homoserine dehydrogenase I [Prevotellaceae bacterium]|jgi:aspartokinase/homoserine dehydrogenase 1|nr:bifunctional aspartate kinase/homoserine dehydrogenase I [Prevotellaceae bacterium]